MTKEIDFYFDFISPLSYLAQKNQIITRRYKILIINHSY